MTDLVDRWAAQPVPPDTARRVLQPTRSAWPHVERRRGPRRLQDALTPDRRSHLIALPDPVFDLAAAPPAGGSDSARNHHVRGYQRAVLAIDIAGAIIGVAVVYVLLLLESRSPNLSHHLLGACGLVASWLLAVATSRAYEPRFLANSAEEYRRILHAALGLAAAVATFAYVLDVDRARLHVLVSVPICMLFALVGRYAARRALRRVRARGRCLQDMLVVGHEWAVLDLVAEVRRDSTSGLRVIGACVPGGRGSYRMRDAQVPVVGDLDNVVDVATKLGADVLAVTTCVEFGGPELRRVCWALENTGVEVVVAPAVLEVTGPRLHIRPVAGLSLLHVEKPEFSGARRVIKGVFDRVVAGLAVLLLSPLLLSLAAVIRLTSSGPALFRQTRVGERGRPFTIYKFRSMYIDAEQRRADVAHLNDRSEGLLFKIRKDPRVTRVGQVLRRYSLDELPQLLNVVKGDMSLVGPRPPLATEVEQYADHVRRRLLVKPGVTGLWQVSGRSDLPWEEAVRLDLRYVENWSLALDLMILWRTAFAVVRGAGAY